MTPGGIFFRSGTSGGHRTERPVWPRLAAFVGLSLLVHGLLALLDLYEELPMSRRREPLSISLFTPAPPPPELTAPRPVAPRRRTVAPLPPPPRAPAAATPLEEAPPAPESSMAESPEATGTGDASHEEAIGHARAMEERVKLLQKKRVPEPDQLAMTRATPRAETNPRPQYPTVALRNGWQGVVQLRVWVSDEGRVDKVVVAKSSGHSILDERAVHAVRYWRFVPARRGEVAVADIADVAIPFRLNQ